MMCKPRFALVHLALIAMVLRAMLPVGWMPDASAKGGFSFVICTMNGPLQYAGTKQTPRKKLDDGRQHDACPFAASAHLATTVAAALLAPPALSLAPVFRNDAHVLNIRAAHYARPAPRAPPAIV